MSAQRLLPFRLAPVAALALTLTAAAVAPARAASDKDFDNCWGDDYALRLTACPRLFEDTESSAELRASAHFNRARAFEAQGEWDKAIDDYDAGIKLDPGGADYHFARARAYAATGDTENEFAGYAEAISRSPREAEYRGVRGAACQAQGDLDGAIADYSAAIRLAPKAASSYFYRGDAYRLRGETDKALADFSAALAQDPDASGALLARAGLYRAKRDYAAAIADYSSAIAQQPDLAGAYFGRGLARLGAADTDGAIMDLSIAAEFDPTNAALRNMRGFALAARGEFDRAIADHDAAILIDPSDAYRYTVRAWAYMKAGKPDAALQDAERALMLNDKLPSGYAVRAHIREAAGKKDEAIADYRKALALAPSMKDAREGLTRLGETGLPEIVPVAAAAAPAPFDEEAYRQGLYEETASDKPVFARRDDVSIVARPDASLEEEDFADEGDKLDVVARLKPKKGQMCGVDSSRGWYKVRLAGGGEGYVAAGDVFSADQQALVESKALIAKRAAEYEDKNSGSLKDFAGVYDGLKDCSTTFDESMMNDGLMLSIAFGTSMLVRQVIWFDGDSMYSSRFSNPSNISRARLKFQRNFNLSGGGTIKLYRATYDKGNPETLGFYNDKLVIDPKIKGNRITYNYATRCDQEADMVEWAGKVYDARIENAAEE